MDVEPKGHLVDRYLGSRRWQSSTCTTFLSEMQVVVCLFAQIMLVFYYTDFPYAFGLTDFYRYPAGQTLCFLVYKRQLSPTFLS